jgi:hypothetical protein
MNRTVTSFICSAIINATSNSSKAVKTADVSETRWQTIPSQTSFESNYSVNKCLFY